MNATNNIGHTGNIPLIGQNKITVSMTPGAIAGTFDVQIDTSTFQYGVPLAAQVLLQATMMLMPVAYQAIANTKE